MSRYKILIEYEGTNYYGWQRQPEGQTVEAKIEEALSQILRHQVDIIGQGRTDSGVHARGQVAHFDSPEDIEPDQLLYAVLGVLPRDIAIHDVEQVENDFHARFNARSRRYRFQIALRPTPINRRYAQMVLDPLDIDLMKECAASIVGIHDFESFTKSTPDQERTKCDVTLSQFEQLGHLLIYEIEANRFLRHMVRRLVGTMIQVGTGRQTVDEFMHLLNNPNQEISGHGAQAKGLFLEEVTY